MNKKKLEIPWYGVSNYFIYDVSSVSESVCPTETTMPLACMETCTTICAMCMYTTLLLKTCKALSKTKGCHVHVQFHICSFCHSFLIRLQIYKKEMKSFCVSAKKFWNLTYLYWFSGCLKAPVRPLSSCGAFGFFPFHIPRAIGKFLAQS